MATLYHQRREGLLTNGPIADLILLLATTGVADGREYSIFLVPRETPGIEETEGVKDRFPQAVLPLWA